MKNLFIVLVSLGFSLQSFADACGAKLIQVGDKKVELIQVKQKPETTASGQTIKGSSDVLVSGIYMFVRNGQTWNTYRCADEMSKNPTFNSEKCVLKNDFQSGQLVKRFGNSGITVRNTDQRTLQIRMNVAGGEDFDYYDVKATEKGLEVLENQFKPNKTQPSLSRHERVSLGVCNPAAEVTGPAKAGFPQTPAKKVGITN